MIQLKRCVIDRSAVRSSNESRTRFPLDDGSRDIFESLGVLDRADLDMTLGARANAMEWHRLSTTDTQFCKYDGVSYGRLDVSYQAGKAVCATITASCTTDTGVAGAYWEL